MKFVRNKEERVITFDKLPEEKRFIILNAGFSCFGKNGYQKTSIADISAAAGISKASMFQYFQTKRKLYLYLFKYSCDMILKEMPVGTDDFFECILRGSETKINVMSKHPGMFDFLSSLVTKSDIEIIADLRQSFEKQIKTVSDVLFSSVNWNKFKPCLSREKVMNIVKWLNDGYVRDSAGHKEAVTMRRELWEYMDIIKQAFYKEEFLK